MEIKKADELRKQILSALDKAIKNLENGVEVETTTKNAVNVSSADNYTEYDKPITISDINTLRSIGRKSINDFTSDDIKKSQKWAYKFYQQMETKSPFFRAWFGDYRAYEKKPKTDAIIVKYGYGEKLPINESKRTIVNRDTGFSINISGDIVDDSLHYGTIHGDKKHIAQVLGRIDEIVERAILIDTQISVNDKNNKKGSTCFMHYLYSPITINNAPFLAKLTVEEYGVDNKKRGYNVLRIKMSSLQTSQFSDLIRKSRQIGSSVMDGISVADLYSLVKKYDKDFHPGKEVNPALLDENGEPKVFYHGTNKKFNVFKNIKGIHFFSESIDYAEELAYEKSGNTVLSTYLNCKNPLEVELAPNEFSDPNAEEKYIQQAKSQGNDSIIFRLTGIPDYQAETFIAVFNANQIKSATDNIGTFDSDNDDIHYSVNVDTTVNNSSLLKENKKLGEMVEYWKRMARLSKQTDYKRQDVRRVALNYTS